MPVSRQKTGVDRNRELNGGAPNGWRAVLPISKQVEIDQDAPMPIMYGIVSTWQDADIVEAVVRNCFVQGCSKVFLLDNASDDDTVQRATSAGATVGLVYKTEMYDDDLRIRHENDIIRAQTRAANLPELWWMVLDSDEFPTGPTGGRVIDHLRGLPKEIRVVGNNSIDLYPSEDHHYEIGKHPAACMLKAHWRWGGVQCFCQCGHWKHTLIRLFDGIQDMCHNRGNHTVTIDRPKENDYQIRSHAILEPHFQLPLFHAPIRRKEDAYNRLRKLCGTGRNKWDDQVTNNHGAGKRYRSLDMIFTQQWSKVEIPHTQIYGRPVVGLALYPWTTLLPDFDQSLITW